MTRNLTCFDVSVGRPAHPNLCFEKSDQTSGINLVKRYSQFSDKSALISPELHTIKKSKAGERKKSINIR